jgi:hypothetical protein
VHYYHEYELNVNTSQAASSFNTDLEMLSFKDILETRVYFFHDKSTQKKPTISSCILVLATANQNTSSKTD